MPIRGRQRARPDALHGQTSHSLRARGYVYDYQNSGGRQLHVIDPSPTNRRKKIDHKGQSRGRPGVAFSPDGTRVMSATKRVRRQKHSSNHDTRDTERSPRKCRRGGPIKPTQYRGRHPRTGGSWSPSRAIRARSNSSILSSSSRKVSVPVKGGCKTYARPTANTR